MIVYRLDTNRGKGAAVMHGFDLAARRDLLMRCRSTPMDSTIFPNLAEFVALGEAHPDALIAGAPVYDATMPRATTHRPIDHALLGRDRDAHDASGGLDVRVTALST